MCRTYLITFHTYGSWLPGTRRGSVDRKHNLFQSPLLLTDPKRQKAARQRQKQGAVRLNARHRKIVREAVREVCEFRQWQLRAINVRTNHVHVVVTARARAEKVIGDFKSYATRRLRESKLCDAGAKMWSRHGSTPFLPNEEAVAAACRYVVDRQGPALAEK